MAESIDLPPGFRFHPTDEEIISHYLSPKVLNPSFSPLAIGEVDLNKCEPWDLPSKAKMGEKEWYFFCQRDRKYPTGMRTNRATEAGYWKATGKDKEIHRGWGSVVLVGMKKTLVFYRGRAPKGEKTNWVMHEFRLDGKTLHQNLPKPSKDEWVVCRVFHKSTGDKKIPMPQGLPRMNSFGEDLLGFSSTLPPLMDPLYLTGGADQDFDLKGMIPSCTTSMLSPYFSTLENPIDQVVAPSSMFSPLITPPAPLSGLPGPSGNSSHLHQEQAMLRALAAATATNGGSNALRGQYCKAEQLSNHSMVSASQDTGVSTDRNTEISSCVSKHEMGSFGEFDDPSSAAAPVMDLENMWKY